MNGGFSVTTKPPPPLPVDVAVALLGATDDPTLQDEIFERIDREEIIPALGKAAAIHLFTNGFISRRTH
jgi:hypothetical protein